MAYSHKIWRSLHFEWLFYLMQVENEQIWYILIPLRGEKYELWFILTIFKNEVYPRKDELYSG